MLKLGGALLALVVVAFVLGVAAFVLTHLFGGGSSVHLEQATGVQTIEGHPHLIIVGVETEGQCLGTQDFPTLESLKVEEEPQDKATLFAWVRNYGNESSGCAGVGTGLQELARTRRPASSLAFYDGSETPPRRMGVGQMSPREYRQWRRELHKSPNLGVANATRKSPSLPR